MIDAKFIKQLEDTHFYLIFASLISADSLTDLESCKHNLKIAEELKKSIDNAEISEMKREAWIKCINNGINIIKQEIEKLKNNG